MTRVQIPAATGGIVAAHAVRAHPRRARGLLVGHASADGTAHVVRVVRCPDRAEGERGAAAWSVDAGAVANVRRTLRGTPFGVLGFYHAADVADAPPSAADVDGMRRWPRMVWLVAPVAAGAAGALRAWWLDAVDARAPRALDVTLDAPADRPLAGCPE